MPDMESNVSYRSAQSTVTPPLLGASLKKLDTAQVEKVVEWLLASGEAPAPFAGQDCVAVLQCCDSLIWGIYRQGKWLRASEADPETIRTAERVTLLEARVFIPEREILLWRDGDFHAVAFAGRVLADAPAPPENAQHRPILVNYLFDGNPTTEPPLKTNGFVRRYTAGGNVLVVPAGKGLQVCQYLQECPATGLLRIAATRFAQIIPETGDPDGGDKESA